MGGDEDFDDVLEANAAYAERFTLGGLEPKAARKLAVVTCIDSRIEPLPMLGLRPGDAKILRNAGARVTDDVARSLFVASHLLDVERVMIVAHTKCAMAQDESTIREAIADAGGTPADFHAPLLAAPSQVATVRADVEVLRSSPHLARVTVGGFVYDVDTGAIERIC